MPGIRPVVFLTLACAAFCADGCSAPLGTAEGRADAADAQVLPEGGDERQDAPSEPEAEAGPEFDFDGERMMGDVKSLASPELEGRLAGSTGGELAVALVESHFTDTGLQPYGTNGFRTAFSFQAWRQTGPSGFDVAGVALQEGADFRLLQGSGDAEVSAELVFAGYGMTVPPFDPALHPQCPLSPAGYDDYDGVDVIGKIVVVLRHGPAEDARIQASCPANEAAKSTYNALWDFGYKSANARAHGAAAAVIVNNFAMSDPKPIEGSLGAEYQAEDFAVLTVHRDKLAEWMTGLATWQATIDDSLTPATQSTGLQAHVRTDTVFELEQADNLIATYPGVDPELAAEAIVFGAHVDHLGKDPVTGETYAGADDNASGVAVVMELARALAAGLIEPRRTVILAAFNAEEQGILGSCAYVKEPAWPLGATAAMFSLDMVGAGNETGVDLYGANGDSFAWIRDTMAGSAAAMGLDYTVGLAGPLDASDHACFAYAGVPAVLTSSRGEHSYYHTPKDTPDTLTPGNLEVTARLAWAALVALAMGQEQAANADGGPAQGLPGSEAAGARIRGARHAAGWIPGMRTGPRTSM